MDPGKKSSSSAKHAFNDLEDDPQLRQKASDLELSQGVLEHFGEEQNAEVKYRVMK
ncbi:hypothetical protein ABHI18_002821 [Aspergillus niger]